MRSVLEGAAEVNCGMLSKEASLELLLRTGGCAHLLDAPPPAALDVVEQCDRLPLALSIAGGIMAAAAQQPIASRACFATGALVVVATEAASLTSRVAHRLTGEPALTPLDASRRALHVGRRRSCRRCSCR